MRREIPASVIAAVSDVIADAESHATLENLFHHADAPGDPPQGNKVAKAQEWPRRTNKDASVDPLAVLGKLIEGYMEADVDEEPFAQYRRPRKEKIERALARNQLLYVRGGHVTASLASPSRSLEDLIRGRDLAAIDEEFSRALRNVEADPPEALSAACNVLESLCRTYIEDEKLTPPSRFDLPSLWTVVRKDLGFDPSKIEDDDLRKILSGLISTVDGVGSLRTHASRAHGQGRKNYKIEPRHARLAVHAAHTVASFVIETWDKKRRG